MKRELRFMLVLLLATLCPAMAEKADDPVAVRVGDFTYTQSVLQGSVDSVIELSRMLSGDAPTEVEKAARLQGAANAAGIVSNAAGGNKPVELVFALNRETRRMELQRPAVSNSAVSNAIVSGLFPNEIEAGQTVDVTVNVYDISVGHRVYMGWDGRDWLDIYLRNHRKEVGRLPVPLCGDGCRRQADHQPRRSPSPFAIVWIPAITAACLYIWQSRWPP